MSLQPVNPSTINQVTNIPDEYRKKFLKTALLAWHSPGKNCYHIVETITKDLGLSTDETYEVIGIYIKIVKLFLHNNYNDFTSKLLEIGFTSDFISKLSLLENQNDLISKLNWHCNNNFNKISLLKWRIDISLTDSVIRKKVPKPVILCLTINNGEKYTIRIDAKMFNKLRFNVALMLKELNSAKSYSSKLHFK